MSSGEQISDQSGAASRDEVARAALLKDSALAVMEVGVAKLVGSCRHLECGSDEGGFKKGDLLLVDTERGLMYARAVVDSERKCVDRTKVHRIMRRLWGERARQALDRDRQTIDNAKNWFKKLVSAHGLEMSYSSAELVHGPQKIVIYFTAPSRQDFRALLRDLSHRINMRVELRQIGVRDETKCMGGIGPCGLVVCCHQFLREFGSVTIKMAKTQGLVLSPQKVSGLCGRLMCCLAYEYPFYCEAAARFPRIGANVRTPKGPGRVRDVNILRSKVKVALDSGEIDVFGLDELKFKRTASIMESEPVDETSVEGEELAGSEELEAE